MGPKHVPGNNKHQTMKSNMVRVMILMGRSQEEAEEDCVACGNIVGLSGLHQVITIGSTLTGKDNENVSRIAVGRHQPTENMKLMKDDMEYVKEELQRLKISNVTYEINCIEQKKLTKECQLSLTGVQKSLQRLEVLSKGWCLQDLNICAGEILKWSVKSQG
jgi:hypothetical protein